MTDDWLDFYLDNILKASGSALKHYSMQKTKDDMRQALRQAIAGLESQEPVALETVYETIIQWDEGGGKRSRRDLARRIIDLYTHPPQRTEQEAVAWMKPDVLCDRACMYLCTKGFTQFPECANVPPQLEQNFCPRCGKRTNDIHTCTPPQRTWQGLTDEEVADIERNSITRRQAIRAIEAKLKQKNGFAEEKNT